MVTALGPDVERVLSVIREAGGRPMLVGGFVRDLIMDRAAASKDIDVEVYALTFAALAEALGRAGRVDEVGKSYGVLKIRAGDTDLDVNVPLRERKIGTGHRGFDITPDMSLDYREASARRDFTMNAILLDPEAGTVIDCHGGLEDIAAGVLRHTSDAFAEDPLRVLRAVQFAARFGFHLAPETAALCHSLAGSYGELPVERVWCEVEKIGTAALLHDVGKIYDKYAPILLKQDRLTPQEWAIIKEHPNDGANLIATMTRLREMVPAVRHHHENWDGTGYPEGLKEDEIPLASRVIMFADTFDAMTTKRPYRGPMGEEEVRSELIRCRGRQFDPDITDRLLASDFWRTLFPPADRAVRTPRFMRLIGSDTR